LTMRNVEVRWAKGKLAQDVEVGGHRIRSDEEVEKRGEDTGATPHELLLAALGSCTAMTLKVYAERKGWPLEDVKVTLTAVNGEGAYIITRQVALDGHLDEEQRTRLLEIADKCPVHRTLSGTITINTSAGEV
jgi:putative redox protein